MMDMEAEEMRLALVLKLLDRGTSPWHVGTEAASLMAFIETGEADTQAPPVREAPPSVFDPFTEKNSAELGHDKFGLPTR